MLAVPIVNIGVGISGFLGRFGLKLFARNLLRPRKVVQRPMLLGGGGDYATTSYQFGDRFAPRFLYLCEGPAWIYARRRQEGYETLKALTDSRNRRP
ncbi:hypothetical protein BH23PLA1_BH23PLA1_45040 [soil metagenome]